MGQHVTDKYKQVVWSKKSYALTPEERKNVLENTPKPERFTRQQAKDVEKSNLKGAVGVANSGESGTIEKTEVEPVGSINSIEYPIEQRYTGKGNPNAVLVFGVGLNNRQKAY